MRLTWSIPVVGGALLLAACLLLPAQPEPEGAVSARFGSAGLAAAVVMLSAAIAWIAWRGREWGPTLLALGCLASATGAVCGLLFDGDGVGIADVDRAGDLPIVGMILGGFAAMAMARPYPTTSSAQVAYPRIALLGGLVLLAAGASVLLMWPALVPGETGMRVAMAVGGTGYLMAGLAFARAYHLLRLPPQGALAGGTLALAAASPFAAVGGIPGVERWAFDLMFVVIAGVPAAGFMAEHRARPGLRTLALGISLPGAIAQLKRGEPAQMGRVLEMISRTDGQLVGHLGRVGTLASELGQRLGVPAAELRPIVTAARCHDIGKIYIPRGILDKPAKLTDEEFVVMRTHAALGEALVGRVLNDVDVARAVGEHHEKWDGRGYPAGKRGEEISLAGRIIAVADVYDALVSRRSYKEGWSPAEALETIRRDAGSHFDPWIVDTLEEVVAPREYALPGPVKLSA